VVFTLNNQQSRKVHSQVCKNHTHKQGRIGTPNIGGIIFQMVPKNKKNKQKKVLMGMLI
jgi:hypothetical protein